MEAALSHAVDSDFNDQLDHELSEQLYQALPLWFRFVASGDFHPGLVATYNDGERRKQRHIVRVYDRAIRRLEHELEDRYASSQPRTAGPVVATGGSQRDGDRDQASRGSRLHADQRVDVVETTVPETV
jgi:hypothetical protein